MPIKKQIEINKLLINEQNPRFHSVKNQKLAITTMLKLNKMDSKIKKLAEDIVTNGLNPAKPFLVLKKKNGEKYIVLEGNRRLISILLINNPNIVSLDEEVKKFFRKLQIQYESRPIKKINCVIFSKQEIDEANHWIELEHTGENKGVGQVPWNSEQVARFQSQNSKSNRMHFKVIDFMKKNNIFLKKNQSTNIERIINTKYAKEKIGIKFENGKLSLIKDKSVVINNLKKIAEKINQTDFSVKDIYDAEGRLKWIDNLLKEKSPPKKIVTRRNGKSLREREIPTNRSTLIPESITFRISQERINKIYKELKTLKVDKYRNAVAVLFRVFLELSVKQYIIDKELKNKKLLYKNIKEVVNYMEQNQILKEDELSYIQKATLSDSTHNIFSTNTLNDYVHNVDHTPASEDLKIIWSNVQKFMLKLWE